MCFRMSEIISLLHAFVSGVDRSIDWAKTTEAAIDDIADDDDPRFEELREHLASYQPRGGAFLYGEREMLEACRVALETLTEKDG